MTGSHGTGVDFGNIATLVTKLELVTGEGESLTLSANNHSDIFKAAQVSKLCTHPLIRSFVVNRLFVESYDCD